MNTEDRQVNRRIYQSIDHKTMEVSNHKDIYVQEYKNLEENYQ